MAAVVPSGAATRPAPTVAGDAAGVAAGAGAVAAGAAGSPTAKPTCVAPCLTSARARTAPMPASWNRHSALPAASA